MPDKREKASMDVKSKYIYGIINSNGEKRDVGGLPAGISTISYQDISAVVSESEPVNLATMSKDTLARLLLKHQMVIEEVMPEHTIIPMRLGTLADSEKEATEILHRGYCLIKDIFEKIEDKIEIDLVATWNDFTSVLKETGEEEEIQKFKATLLTNSEAITTQEQMKIGMMVKDALDRKRERCRREIQAYLKDCWESFKDHERMNDQMVASLAFLINRHKEKDFDKRIDELNNRFAERLNFRCVGPLPPYSFYTLEIKKIPSIEIDWARKKIGLLKDSVTKDEIEEAYLKSAMTFHPDKNPDAPEAEKAFDEVTKAYKILLDYEEACKQGGQEVMYFGEEDEKKNEILVRVKE